MVRVTPAPPWPKLTADPPLGAAPVNVTVQEAEPKDAIVTGEQMTPDTVVCGIVTAPPVVLRATIHDCGALPRADSETAEEVFVELVETVSVTVATAPSAITF